RLKREVQGGEVAERARARLQVDHVFVVTLEESHESDGRVAGVVSLGQGIEPILGAVGKEQPKVRHKLGLDARREPHRGGLGLGRIYEDEAVARQRERELRADAEVEFGTQTSPDRELDLRTLRA